MWPVGNILDSIIDISIYFMTMCYSIIIKNMMLCLNINPHVLRRQPEDTGIN